jgi:transcriptional regulator with XRE-family HTH domain
MVLVATDLPPEAYTASGSYALFSNPPSIILVLNPEERYLTQTYALYQGSGGGITSFLSISPSGAKTQISPEPRNKLAMAINEISSAFGLTKEALAQVCQVETRKTLYNWINGETTPRKQTMSRIFDLLITARAWTQAGLTIGQAELEQPVLDNQSVLDLLSQPEIDKERILFAGSRLDLARNDQNILIDPFA